MKPIKTTQTGRAEASRATVQSIAAPAQAGFRADRALCALLGDLNRRAAKMLFRQKLVRLNGEISSGAERVSAGDRFEYPDPSLQANINPLEKAKAPRLTTPHGRHLVRLYEDEDILVISKPAEIPVHRGQGGFTRRDTLEEVLMRAYPPKKGALNATGATGTPGAGKSGGANNAVEDDEDDATPLKGGKKYAAAEQGFYFVHRLDMETSGCLLIAKNAKSRDALIKDFSERKIKKVYLAVVQGLISWDQKISTQPIKYIRGESESRAKVEARAAERKPFYSHMRNPQANSRGTKPKPGQKKGVALEEGSTEGKACETQFRTLERFRGFTLMHVSPKTGRMHQIRVHLAALGHPLCYDQHYGRKSPWRLAEFDPSSQRAEHGEQILLNRLPLHAWKLGFTHPVSGEKILLEAPLPADLKQFIRTLRKFRAIDNKKA